MKQEKQEKVQVYSVQLREALNRLTMRFPDRIPPGDEDKILCDCFFYGMKPELKASVWHLFDSHDVTFGRLLTAARRNELKEVDGKTTKVQSKMGIVEKEGLSPRSESLIKLKEQVNELMTVVKGRNFPKKNNPPPINKTKGNKQSSQSRRNESQNGSNDICTQLSGPETNASGPFALGQRVI